MCVSPGFHFAKEQNQMYISTLMNREEECYVPYLPIKLSSDEMVHLFFKKHFHFQNTFPYLKNYEIINVNTFGPGGRTMK